MPAWIPGTVNLRKWGNLADTHTVTGKQLKSDKSCQVCDLEERLIKPKALHFPRHKVADRRFGTKIDLPDWHSTCGMEQSAEKTRGKLEQFITGKQKTSVKSELNQLKKQRIEIGKTLALPDKSMER